MEENSIPVQQIEACRTYAPQFFGYVDELAGGTEKPEEVYRWACDLVRAVKRKSSRSTALMVINEGLAGKGERPFHLLSQDHLRYTSYDKWRAAEVERLISIRKAGTIVAAWIVGLEVGDTTLDAGNDSWLREPVFFMSGEAGTPLTHYWAGVCDYVGWHCGDFALKEGEGAEDFGESTGDWDEAFPDDSAQNTFMERYPDQYSLANYLDYAYLLHAPVIDRGETDEIAKELRAKRTLSRYDIRRLMSDRDLVQGSLELYPMARTGQLVTLEEATSLNPEDNLVYGELDDHDSGYYRTRYRVRPSEK